MLLGMTHCIFFCFIGLIGNQICAAGHDPRYYIDVFGLYAVCVGVCEFAWEKKVFYDFCFGKRQLFVNCNIYPWLIR